MLAPGVKQSTSSNHSLPATVQHYCQVMIVSMQAIETRLATELETRLQRCKRRDGFTRSGSPHRSPSVCCIVVLSVDYPCRRLLMVSTSQAEAANCPTHATESPVVQRELTSGPEQRHKKWWGSLIFMSTDMLILWYAMLLQ